jgi:hypothetical protein
MLVGRCRALLECLRDLAIAVADCRLGSDGSGCGRSERFWSVVRIEQVDADAQVHFDAVPCHPTIRLDGCEADVGRLRSPVRSRHDQSLTAQGAIDAHPRHPQTVMLLEMPRIVSAPASRPAAASSGRNAPIASTVAADRARGEDFGRRERASNAVTPSAR